MDWYVYIWGMLVTMNIQVKYMTGNIGKTESNVDHIAKKQKEYYIHRGGFNKYCQVLKKEKNDKITLSIKSESLLMLLHLNFFWVHKSKKKKLKLFSHKCIEQ